ncbi:hypothetical protein BDA96_02G080900 [Sorghum bicolor]|uniref:Secreted protein n=1 Tax=Sorghum bicolor TaxID=4558 RepID=A0A921RMI4_SORBI|nr:hypothetical protein BDA96_02G080900 [Sorghum bicolor]
MGGGRNWHEPPQFVLFSLLLRSILSCCNSSSDSSTLLCCVAALCYSALLCHCPSATLLGCVQHSWLLDALVICFSSL